MTVYETLQLYFMAIALGSLVGFAFSLLMMWARY